MFGNRSQVPRNETIGMSIETDRVVAESGAPVDSAVEELDVRELGPPKPLSKTLERLAELEETVLVQLNDRVPQHLYPKLEDRGYEFDTLETDEVIVTVIWEG